MGREERQLSGRLSRSRTRSDRIQPTADVDAVDDGVVLLANERH